MGQDAGKPIGHIIVRYILVGAGLGIYFGYFFRPVREPNLIFALVLAALASLVTVGINWIRGNRPPIAQLLRRFGLSFFQFFLFMLILEGRHYAYDIGGRWLTVLFTTITGAMTGIMLAYSQSRAVA